MYAETAETARRSSRERGASTARYQKEAVGASCFVTELQQSADICRLSTNFKPITSTVSYMDRGNNNNSGDESKIIGMLLGVGCPLFKSDLIHYSTYIGFRLGCVLTR